MSYTNVEILSGVLVVACLLLFWCQRSKNVDGLSGALIPGVRIRDGYTDLPLAGRFSRDGYVTGSPSDNSSSYTARSSYFTENMEDQGLNDLTTTPTPASNDQTTPEGDNTGLWLSESRVNNHRFTTDEDADIYRTVFERHNNRVKQSGHTMSGASLGLIDYGANMVQTRQVTM